MALVSKYDLPDIRYARALPILRFHAYSIAVQTFLEEENPLFIFSKFGKLK